MTLTLNVPSIACEGCVTAIAQSIQAQDPSALVSGDPTAKTIRVETAVSEATIREAIAAAGHEVAS
ncbi:copper chaperone [Rubidibacter lacunae KORDI 51-2]|uniref:Copper chaperone n=1 Tax=Rubidibacter lacunae KORDI 51-2 TaxID=582515 RepID=U5DDJ7_9CHRO|nr:heavy-metal-associated domain-containing protein [Rubidibacter lacunae]ERN42578.1 copper chaperone [Rubidibacter lacunae KORDI 51-2]